MKLADLSDAQLLAGLKSLCGQSRAVLARLLAHLVEVEKRRLHLEAACPSLFQFCVLRLGMSEDEACRRIHAARLVGRFPDLLVRIERGDLTLSTIALLHDKLTTANYEELVEAAAGKTKAEVQVLLAKRFPAPDVPAAITAIPVQSPIPTLGVEALPTPATAGAPQLTPLSDSRHKVQFTASDELRKKLEHAQGLMRHANAEGDLAAVVERAVDLLLERLEKQRLGKTSHPRPPREQGDTVRIRGRRAARSSNATASAAPSQTQRGIAARRRPGSSSITSSREDATARVGSETCASAAAPTTSSMPSRPSARSTSRARSASEGIRASADTHRRVASSRPADW